jgi:hypothetical protein
MKFAMTIQWFLVACSIAFLPGCTRQIPNKVTADEYAIYSEWTTAHFKKNPPEHLYFSIRTGIFDPLDAPCKGQLEKVGDRRQMMSQLHALGDAEYPLDLDSPDHLHIPWSYKAVDTAPDLAPGSFHMITFSRVAFSRDHTEALFGVFDACAFGDCGRGGYIEGSQKNGSWSFRPVGCVVIS